MKKITLLSKNEYTKVLLFLFHQLHLIIIAIVLLLFGVESASAQCPTPPGNQTAYGNGSWIGYIYSDLDSNNPPANTFTSTYRGYVTQPEIFDQNLGSGSISGANLCGSYSDKFSMRFKMQKVFTAGYYTFTIGGDDGYRLSIDGGSTFAISDWNYHSYQTSTATIYLSGLTYMVLESYDQGGESRIYFNYTACTSFSTAPTSILGTSSICNGTSTTLTADGGTLGSGSSYQWGTGTTVGSNVISGQTGVSITVSPTTNTTYWVRRIDPAPCSVNTAGVTLAVTVTNPSTSPTSISGTTTLCLGNSTTLTATGGTLAAGCVYEWGTGTTGSNIISGQSGVSITVSPSATTTYWVRRTNTAPCTPYTNAATVSVTVNVPVGDQTSYGNNSWIGYVYSGLNTSNPPSNIATATYRGYVTQTETFDQNLGSASLSGANLCGSYADQFFIRFKMTKNFTPGYYTFTVGGDDGYRLSLDGGSTFPVTNFVDHSYVTTTSTKYYLSGPVDLVLEYYEQGTSSQVSFNYTSCTNFSSAPTGISGTTSLCTGTGGTTLTATGGYEAPGATYQWGTGSVIGSNIISGVSYNGYYINPTTTITYWVRRYDAASCNLYSDGVTQTITVSNPSTNPSAIGTTASTICSGTTITLTATGGTLAAGGSYQWGTGWTVGSNIISGQTAATLTVAPTVSTVYWTRRIDPTPCNTQTPGVTVSITVATPSAAPTGITGPTTSCSGTSIQLTATGATVGTNGSYQWGTGSTPGNNVISGQNGVSLYVNPTTTTTYWVRLFDTAPCSASTSGITQTVTVSSASTAPTGISGSTTVCNGSSVTLTATGGTLAAGGSYQWGSGSSAGSNIISGQTGVSITVSPTASGSYWVRRLDPAPCNTQTSGATVYISVSNPSVGPTAISGTTSLCYGTGGTTLTATGGTLGTSANYQWGTGSTIGSGIISGATSSTYYINPNTTTTYWVRIVDGTPCSASTTGASVTVTAATASTAPTGISGTISICNGNSTTLTATGGTAATGSSYQWGTGWTVGSNIISGQTGISITVSPTSNTVYWVRRTDTAPCNTQTGGPTTTVTVTNPSTPPTSITGAGAAACAGNSTTLTATGGTAATGSTYQWGTGTTIGSNVISGQTGVSITVSPTATTTYWVRRYDVAPCSSYTTGVTTTVSISAPPGNPATAGSNAWNVYGYSTADISLATAVYAGYYTTNTLNFDSSSNWNNTLSPSSATGWSGCTVPNDNFTFVSKRQGFPCGTYTLTLQNWDDETRVYLNGTQIWTCATWNGGGACSGNIGSYNLDSTSEIEIRVREASGSANVSLTLTNTNVASTAPTTISGTTSICGGTSTTLTASGGATGTSGSFQWGTGTTVGSNIISGQTAAAISVSPTSSTTYWVRRTDAVCSTSTSGVTQLITVTPGTVAGTLSTTNATICRNNQPNPISLTGQTGNVIKWQSANDAAFTSGVTDIASTATTLTSALMGSISTTKYYRAVVQNSSCSILNTTPLTVTVPAAVTYSNGVWSSTPNSGSSVLISSNLTLNSDLNVCSCQVSAGVTVTVNSGSNLIVQTSLTVDNTANIIIKDKASLVQVDDSSIDVGNITVYKKSAPMKLYDFTYWSSPVQNWRLNQLSPNTLSDKYFSFDPMINNWVVSTNGVAVMAPAKGYIVRAPQGGWSTSNATGGVYEGSFVGVPNTGIIPVTIQKGAGYLNLIGNPYPSAIDIDLFLTDPANSGIVNGTIYLWTHNTAISTTISGNNTYNYTSDDYAKYNLTGGIKTASAAITGGGAPNGKIASGQGFFIEANTALGNGTYTANFKNSMRITGNQNQFYRASATNSTAIASRSAVAKNRLWINITNPQGAYNEILLGYITGATNGYDNLYDGKTLLSGNVLSMYTISGTDNYSIQGRALPFDENDVVPLGFKTTLAGDFTIAIEDIDGLFQTQNVYLIDKLNNTSKNLKTGSYTFTTATGTFDSRFELRFVGSSLGTDHADFNEDAVVMYSKNNQLNIHSTVAIDDVVIYDILGRKLFTAEKINALDFKTNNFKAATEALIVKAKLSNGVTVTRKIILN